MSGWVKIVFFGGVTGEFNIYNTHLTLKNLFIYSSIHEYQLLCQESMVQSIAL